MIKKVKYKQGKIQPKSETLYLTVRLCLLWSLTIFLNMQTTTLQAQVTDAVIDNSRLLFDRGEYQKTIKMLLPALGDTSSLDNNYKNVAVLHMLSTAFHRIGDDEAAYEFYNKYQIIKDTLIRKQQNAYRDSLEAKSQLLLKQKTIISRQVAIDRQKATLYKRKFWILITASGCTFILIVLVLRLRGAYKRNQIIEEQELQAIREKEINQYSINISTKQDEREKIFINMQKFILPRIEKIQTIVAAIFNNGDSNDVHQELGDSLRYLNIISVEIDTIFQRETAQATGRAEALVLCLEGFLSNLGENNLISFSWYGKERDMAGDLTHEILRIVQEFIQNKIKHAADRQAFIELKFEDDALILCLFYSVANTEASDSVVFPGLGMESIRQRMLKINGRIQMSVGEQFNIKLTVPYKPVDCISSGADSII